MENEEKIDEDKVSKKETDLLSIIKSDKGTIDFYLSNVTTRQFKKDVTALMKRINDKEPIREAIKRLSELL